MRRRLSVGLLLIVLLGACGTPEEEVTSGSTTTAAPGAGWEQLPPAPLSPRGGATLTALEDGRLLVVGGDTAPGCHDTLSMPSDAPPDTRSSAAAAGAALIATSAADCAGPERDTRLRDGAILDVSGKWKLIAEAPVALADQTRGVVVGPRVFFWSLPSIAQDGPTGGAWMSYDVEADEWSRLADPPVRDQP